MWTGALSFVGIILKHEYDIDLEQYDVMVQSILAFAVGVGLINNPTVKGKL